MGKHKIAVVGIGGWGKNIVRVCHELGVIAAICDSDTKKADLFSYEYNTPIKTWDQILADPAIDAVAIILPAYLHEQYTKDALRANKHVFVEKPLAMSYLSARDISDLAQKFNKIVMVGHILQYHNAYIKLKSLINSGIIGEIRYIESTRLHLGPVRQDVGIIWELLPHDVSMILGIVNQPDQLNKSVTNIKVNSSNFDYNLNKTTADVIDVNIKFGENIQARIYSSWLHPKKEQKLWVAGTKGTLIFEDTEQWENKLKLVNYNLNKNIICSIELVPAEPLKAEISYFLDCLDNNNVLPRTDYNEACKVVKLLNQIEDRMIDNTVYRVSELI